MTPRERLEEILDELVTAGAAYEMIVNSRQLDREVADLKSEALSLFDSKESNDGHSGNGQDGQ